jgi:hypothetical protein
MKQDEDLIRLRMKLTVLPDGLWRRRPCALLVVKPGRMIYEMGGVAEKYSRKRLFQ